MSLKDILEPQLGNVARQPVNADSQDTGANHQGSSVQKTVNQAFRQIRAQHMEPLEKTFIIDADASPARVQWSAEHSPCLTRSRHKGHWISTQKRRMTLREMMRFQGMQIESIRGNFKDVDLGHMIGNAMSLNVIQRLLYQVFSHLGWLPADLADEWATGTAILYQIVS